MVNIFTGGHVLLSASRAGRAAPLAQRVLDYIRRHDLIPLPQRVLVAVSGGADSVCLLHILAQQARTLGIEAHVAHLDHGLRGAESAGDARYVERLARDLGLPITIEQADVRQYQQAHGIGLEEAAREVRYAFLSDTAARVGAGRVAVGHTEDDQVETILLHLQRGAGVQGLTGMAPIVDWPRLGAGLTVVRPLLAVSRRETEAYCRENGLLPREDSSNHQDIYLRNRIRHELLPRLEERYPGLRRGLLRSAADMAEVSDFLERQASAVWDEVAAEGDGAIALDAVRLLELHPALQSQVVRRALGRLLGDLRDIERRHVDEVIQSLHLPPGRQMDLPRGLALMVDYGRCVIGARAAVFPPRAALPETRLEVPGQTDIPGWTVQAELMAELPTEGQDAGSPYTAYLDADAAGRELAVRARRPGDRFQPLGMSQSKKLQDFMVDARIRRAERDYIPLVCSHGQILWVVGWRIDDRAKVREQTRSIVRLHFSKQTMPSQEKKYERTN